MLKLNLFIIFQSIYELDVLKFWWNGLSTEGQISFKISSKMITYASNINKSLICFEWHECEWV